MVRKILAALVFVFGFSGFAVAGGHLENEKSPEKFLQYYFDAFNAQDAKKLDTVFAKPFQRIRNGETISYTSWREYINFELIKETGWKRSIINETEVVYDSEKLPSSASYSRVWTLPTISLRRPKPLWSL